MRRTYQRGDRIVYRRAICEIDITQLHSHNALPGGFVNIEATVVGSAKGTDFQNSDLIVIPDDYKSQTGIVFASVISTA